MTFRYPLVAIIGLIAIPIAYAILRFVKRRGSFRRGLKVANTAFLKETALYKRSARIHLATSILMEILILVCIASCVILIARPYKRETINQGVRKRDIFLCMDNGIYLDTLNEELLDEMIELVRGMEGDRFGISIYCSASLLYVPMTDDYDYIVMKLEDLKEYFRLIVKLDQVYGAYGFDLPAVLPDNLKAEYEKDYAAYMDLHAELIPPTYLNAWRKGYFLVGDGLASCMYSFPKFGAEDRSRVVLLSTENTIDVNADPLVELDEACDLCAKNRVTVFGLFRGEKAFDQSLEPNGVFLSEVETETDYATAKADLEKNVKKTGGLSYEYGVMSVQDIIRDIRKQKAMLVDEVIVNKDVDQPAIPATVLCISLLGLVILGAVRGS